MSDVLWQDGSQTIRLHREPTDGILQLVGATRFISGSRHYRRVNVRAQLAQLKNAVFLSAEHASETVGAYAIDETALSDGQAPYIGFYRAMLCVDPHYRGRGIGQRLIDSATQWMRERCAQVDRPGLSWGCIAGGNRAARQLLAGTGHTEIGTLSAGLEYQQWTNPSAALTDLDTPNAELTQAWHDVTKAASWRPADLPQGAWVTLADGEDWIACRYHETVLDVTPLTGAFGWIDRHLMSRFPPGRRRFDPAQFHYVSVTHRLHSARGLRLWKPLRNALMHRHQTHFVNVIEPTRSHVPRRANPDLVVSARRLDDDSAPLASGQAMLWPPDM
ncbi:MAG: GNAT family N-acetyltransferase [Pseudomonadota bacterium]